jgi:predicted alpha/beta-fold hydrolase
MKDFKPPFYLRSPMVQTILNSSGLRRRCGKKMRDAAEEQIIDAGDGVRLQGFLSRQKNISPRGLVILLHGWEGSADSAYIIHTGEYLFSAGYNVFRLNYRDHGATHSLNEGLFLGTLIDEVFNAVRKAAADADGIPVFIAGWSIGANFAVRIARRCGDKKIPGLKMIAAVNPPLDPMKATEMIDESPLIRSYFVKKWKRSLAKKQKVFPQIYDINDVLAKKGCMEMTEAFLPRYSRYKNAAEYFSNYTLKSGYLDRIKVPLTIIMSKDDPVISSDDFYRVNMSAFVKLIMQSYGGHCGYITGLKLNAWYEPLMLELFNGAAGR